MLAHVTIICKKPEPAQMVLLNRHDFIACFPGIHTCMLIMMQCFYISYYFWGAEGAPILFSEIGFCMASCSYIYIYVCIYISVKMAAPWGSLNLLSYYSLCPHLRSH